MIRDHDERYIRGWARMGREAMLDKLVFLPSAWPTVDEIAAIGSVSHQDIQRIALDGDLWTLNRTRRKPRVICPAHNPKFVR